MLFSSKQLWCGTNYLGPVHICDNYTVFYLCVMLTIPMQVLTCVSGLPIYNYGQFCFCSRVGKVSTNGMESYGLVSFTVNLIAWSMLLMWCKKFFLCYVHCITKVLSTILFHNLDGLSTVLRATSSKCSM